MTIISLGQVDMSHVFSAQRLCHVVCFRVNDPGGTTIAICLGPGPAGLMGKCPLESEAWP
jgi:hypothetical protein